MLVKHEAVELSPETVARLYGRIRAMEHRAIPSDDAKLAADIITVLGSPLPTHTCGLVVRAVRSIYR